MSSATDDSIDNFVDWFKRLTPEQKKEVWKYIYSPQGSTALKGLFVGPAPGGQSGVCPTCGRAY